MTCQIAQINIDYENLDIYHNTRLNQYIIVKSLFLYLACDLKHTSKYREGLIGKILKLDEVSKNLTKQVVMMQNHAWVMQDDL